MKLLTGLGNPGAKYESNRHNIGFMAVDEIARIHGFSPWRARFQGAAAEGMLDGEKCLLLKPMTYMNESGRAVGEAVRFYRLNPEDVIVFHDELDLSPGKLKVKSGGGNAGHNGLKSISAHIGNDYIRVRMGIGHPGRKDIVHLYVLQDFAKAEREWLGPLLEAVAKSSPALASGNQAVFLNDVARLLNPNPKKSENKNDDSSKVAGSPDQTPSAGTQSKKAGDKEESGLLAEQLKRWRDNPNN